MKNTFIIILFRIIIIIIGFIKIYITYLHYYFNSLLDLNQEK